MRRWRAARPQEDAAHDVGATVPDRDVERRHAEGVRRGARGADLEQVQREGRRVGGVGRGHDHREVEGGAAVLVAKLRVGPRQQQGLRRREAGREGGEVQRCSAACGLRDVRVCPSVQKLPGGLWGVGAVCLGMRACVCAWFWPSVLAVGLQWWVWCSCIGPGHTERGTKIKGA